MVRHLVWDWNGTLFDDLVAVVAATSDSFVALGHLPLTVEQYRAQFTRPIQEFYRKVLGRPLDPAEWRELDRVFHDRYRVHMLRCALAPDALTAIDRWARARRTQSLLSMWRHEELVALTERLGIRAAFARIDGLTGVSGGRKAECLVRHLAALDLDPAEVALVGDSIDDADAAAAVGARCVLYSGGNHTRADLEATGLPVADTLTEALALVTRAARPAGG